MGAQLHPTGQSHDLVAAKITYRHGKAGGEHPAAMHGRHALDQCSGPDRAIDRHWSRTWRQLPPAPPHDQQGQIRDVVGVKVREGHMRDVLPRDTEVRHPVHGPTATIEQQANVARFDEVGGGNP